MSFLYATRRLVRVVITPAKCVCMSLHFLCLGATVAALGLTAANAQDPFDSPMAPLPPQLLGDAGIVEEESDTFPKITTLRPKLPAQTLNPHVMRGPLERELHEVRSIVRELRDRDPREAAEIESAIRKFLKSQHVRARDTLNVLESQRFVSRHLFSRPRFELLDRFIASIRQLGDERTAQRYTTHVQALKALGQATFNVRHDGDQEQIELGEALGVEVHQIAVQRGSALPAYVPRNVDRTTTGFAEISVDHASHPLVLVLSSEQAMVWKVRKSPAARIVAVVLDSARRQQVLGLENTVILNVRDLERLPATMFGSHSTADTVRASYGDPLEALYEVAVTRFSDATYTGEPIVLGSKNKQWLNAYLISRVEALIEDARSHRGRVQAEALADLRFRAVLTDGFPGQKLAASVGEFSVAGPIAETLRPLAHPELNFSVTVSGKTPRIFGLTNDRRFVVVEDKPKSTDLTPIPLPDDLPRFAEFRAMTFDSQRNRILLVARTENTSSLFSFDFVRGVWSKLATMKDQQVAGIYYDAQRDSVWTVVADSTNDRFRQLRSELPPPVGARVQNPLHVVRKASDPPANDRESKRPSLRLADGVHSSARLVQMDSNGKILANVPIRDDVEPLRIPDGMTAQLTFADGKAVLLGTPPAQLQPNKLGLPEPLAYIIEPDTGQLAYHGRVRIHERVNSDGYVNSDGWGNSDRQLGDSNISNPTALPTASGDQRNAIAEITSRISLVSTWIDSKDDRTFEQQQVKERLHAELASVESLLYDGVEPKQTQRTHVVARYSATEPVAVRVTDTSGPVTLVLCGNHRIEWSVTKAPNANVDRIILSGHLPQKLLHKPAGARIETYFGKDGISAYDPRNRKQLLRLQTRIAELCDGRSADSMAVSHHATGTQVLGPEDGSWRLQVVHADLQKILRKTRDSGNPQKDERPLALKATALKDLRFHAVHHGALPRSRSSSGFRGPADFASASEVHWNQFSLKGPLIGRGLPIQRNVRFAVSDPSQRWLWTGTVAALTMTDLKNETEERLDLRFGDQFIGHLAGIGFDAAHNRLLIHASRGLFAYSFPEKRLTRLRAFEGLTRAAFAYSTKKRTGYAVHLSTGSHELNSIERFNAHGVQLPPLKLSQPIQLQSSQGYGFASVQLLCVDDYLVLLRYMHQHTQRFLGGQRIRTTPTGKLSIIEVGQEISSEGRVIQDTAVQPSLVFRNMSGPELALLWEQLGEPHPKNLDGLLWKFAAGGESALPFLQEKYKADSQPLPDEELAQLVEELNSPLFSVRERAFETLQNASSRIATTLSTFLDTSDSPEVRSRLRRILANWRTGVPQSEEELRQVRALEILSRMGLPGSDEFLHSLLDQRYPALIRFHVMRVVE